MKQEQAAELGQRALIFLAGDPDALGGFLAASGADASEVRGRAADPGVPRVRARLPAAVGRARARLRGHGLPPARAAAPGRGG